MNPLQQVLEDTLLRAAKEVEDQLDSQLHQLDNMDEDDIEKLRRKRIEEMKRWVVWLSFAASKGLAAAVGAARERGHAWAVPDCRCCAAVVGAACSRSGRSGRPRGTASTEKWTSGTFSRWDGAAAAVEPPACCWSC